MLLNNLFIIIIIVSVCSVCADDTISSYDSMITIFKLPFCRLPTIFKLSNANVTALEYIACNLSAYLKKTILYVAQIEHDNEFYARRRSVLSVVESLQRFPDLIKIGKGVFFAKTSNDETFRVEGRHRYRRLFPILVGAYMILSTILIPIIVKFMMLLVSTSLFLSKLSAMASLGGNFNKPTPSLVYSHPYYPHYRYQS